MPDEYYDPTHLHTERLMRLEEVLHLVPIGRTTFYRLIKQGIAPAPIKAGPRISLWRRNDIEAMVRRWEDGAHRANAKKNKA